MPVKHIGIIGVSSPGAALCYTTICLEAQKVMGLYANPEITLHSQSFAEYLSKIEKGDVEGIANLLLASAKALAKVGANFAIIPDNTVHIAFEPLAQATPIPILHIAEAVCQEASATNYHRLGLLGTRFTMRWDIYPRIASNLGIQIMTPSPKEQKKVDRIIFSQLVFGVVRQESRDFYVEVIRNLAARGADAVILGCTEIPLLVDNTISPIPTLDSTRILARAALKQAFS